MIQSARQRRVLEHLRLHQTLSVEEAVELLESSPATVRRDFNTMADGGSVERVRGGVRALDPDVMVPFSVRLQRESHQKEAIARAAMELLRPNDVVLIDGGTTTFAFASDWPDMPLKVITNSLLLAAELDQPRRRDDGLELYLTGGYLHPASGLLLGPGAVSSLNRYYANWAFLSASAVGAGGIFNTGDPVAEFERQLIARADKVVVLADNSKLGAMDSSFVCDLDTVDILITDLPLVAPEFAAAGVEIIVAGA
jgi:DeoR/GlpR family transcriptional regulator of sugar metabolism